MKALILMVCLTFVSAALAEEVSTDCVSMNQSKDKKEVVVSKPVVTKSNGSSAQ